MYPPETGAHEFHALAENLNANGDQYAVTNTECGKCHDLSDASATHLNALADVSVDPQYRMAATLPSYDDVSTTCSNVVCHYTTSPAWFGTGETGTTCNLCHAVRPTSGKHNEHLTAGATCGSCHDGAVEGTTPPANHNDGTVEVYDATPGDLSWDGSSCSTACHYGGTPSWDSVTPLTCTSCHNDGLDSGLLANADPGTNKHGIHMDNDSYVNDCDSCHGSGANTASHGSHVNGTPDVAPALGFGSGTCSTNSCHGPNTASDWSLTGWLECVDCHASGYVADGVAMPSTGLHNMTASGVTSHDETLLGGTNGCTACHDTAATSTHIDGNADANAFISRTGMTWTPGAVNQGTCFGTGLVACHSDGGVWTRKWSTEANVDITISRDPSGAVCSVCHGTWTSWNTGTTHANAGATKGQGHEEEPVSCDQCHAYEDPDYVSPSNRHENGSVTMNSNGTSYGRDATTAGCGQCHNAFDAGHAFPQSVFPSDTVVGPTVTPDIESTGGMDCGPCHAQMHNTMIDTTANAIYKHVLNASVGDDPAETTIAQPAVLGSQTDPNRKCVMCHADHDLWSPAAGGSAANRARNLRSNISELPTVATVRDSDFVSSDTYGGICLSCHMNEQTKAITTPNGVVHVPPVPYPDQADPTKAPANAIQVFAASTHGYAAASGPFADATQFKGVCSKCHDGGLQKQYQTAEPEFGAHQSVKNSFYAVMGTGNYKDYVRANVSGVAGNTLTLDVDLVKDYTTYSAVVMREDGTLAQRSTVSSTSYSGGAGSDSITVAGWPEAWTPVIGDLVQITKPITPMEEICFNCHSQGGDGVDPWAAGGEGYKDEDRTDYYKAVFMQDRLEKIRGLFVGFGSGIIAAEGTAREGGTWYTYVCDDNLAGTYPPDGSNWVGYTLRIKSGASVGVKARIVDSEGQTPATNPAACGSVTNWVKLSSRLTRIAVNDRFEIIKPSFHPLDTTGMHEPGEFLTASVPTGANNAWNVGDSGTCGEDAADGSATLGTSATQCTDGIWDGSSAYIPSKAWGVNQFLTSPPLQIEFIDGSCLGKGTFNVTGNTAYVLTFENTQTKAGCTPGDGDRYVLGRRHISCGDCHNTHAAEVNPSGATAGLITTNVASWVDQYTVMDDTKTTAKTGWAGDRWKGYLLVVTEEDPVAPKWAPTEGFRQVRQITGTVTNGTATYYTVGIPFTTPLPTEFTYEVIRHNGDTGSGGKGVWGVEVTGYSTPGQAGNTLTFTKYFDTGPESTVGTGSGKQYMQCMRCHSYYGFADARPNAPSGGPNGAPIEQEDIAEKINPNNYAHHAVYDVGNNQPLPSNGTSTAMTLPASWPTLTGNATVSNGVVSFATGLPRNALPGWYVRLGTSAGSPWYQLVYITSANNFTIANTGGNPWDPNAVSAGINYSGNITITAGLGNTFTPPFGPWSIIRCSDCHGSTTTDPLGPHASVNRWLLREAAIHLKFEHWSTTNNPNSIVTVDYEDLRDAGSGGPYGIETRYTCLNCHRGDVYGPKALAAAKVRPQRDTMSRIPHGEMWVADGAYISLDSADSTNNTYWPQYCRHCHSGDQLGGIHGTWNAGTSDLGQLGKRFMNGATWSEYSPVSQGKCYTQGAATSVSNCAKHSKGTAFTFNFQYDYTD